MIAGEWVTVTKQEFDTFIKNYPRPITSSCSYISEPPTISYYDKLLRCDIAYCYEEHGTLTDFRIPCMSNELVYDDRYNKLAAILGTIYSILDKVEQGIYRIKFKLHPIKYEPIPKAEVLLLENMTPKQKKDWELNMKENC